MTTRKATKLELVQPDLEQMEAAVTEAASQSAPMVSRHQEAFNRVQLLVNELTRERDTFNDRRTLLRAQFEAADAGLAAQIADIESTMRLYEGGLNALPVLQGT